MTLRIKPVEVSPRVARGTKVGHQESQTAQAWARNFGSNASHGILRGKLEKLTYAQYMKGQVAFMQSALAEGIVDPDCIERAHRTIATLRGQI